MAKCNTCNGSGCGTCRVTVHALPQLPAVHDIGLSDALCVVMPEFSRNTIVNPNSFPPNYTSGTIGSNTPQPLPIGTTPPQYITNINSFGGFAERYSAANNNNGFFYETQSGGQAFTPSAGQHYAFAVYFRAPAGTRWRIFARDAATGNRYFAEEFFTATGEFKRESVSWHMPLDNIPLVYGVEVVDGLTQGSFFDAANPQLEAGAHVACGPTTHIDGAGNFAFDMGFLPRLPDIDGSYRWNGDANNSRSRRSRYANSGGICKSFGSCGFTITGVGGLELPTFNPIRQQYARLDSSAFNGMFLEDTQFTINGRLSCCEPGTEQYHCMRSCFDHLMSRSAGAPIECRDKIMLIYRCTDNCGEFTGREGYILCSYTGGGQGSITNKIGVEDIVLTFVREPEIFGPLQRINTPIGPTDAAGNIQLGADVTGPAAINRSLCHRGTIASNPVFSFSMSADLAGATIVNQDTDHAIRFNANAPTMNSGRDQLVIRTGRNPLVIIRNRLTNAVTDLTPFLLPTSDLNRFAIVNGINNLSFEFPRITNPNVVTGPINNLAGPNRYTFSPPHLNLAVREKYAGISELCCPPDPCGKTHQIRQGFVQFPENSNPWATPGQTNPDDVNIFLPILPF